VGLLSFRYPGQRNAPVLNNAKETRRLFINVCHPIWSMVFPARLPSPPNSFTMSKSIITISTHHLIAVVLLVSLPVLFVACSNGRSWYSAAEPAAEKTPHETSLDQEIRSVMEKGISLEERKRQVPVIEAVFAKKTTPERARNLAALCYIKTLGTPFAPLDMAEIALAETGGHALSSRATSSMGAVGVWQLMPSQARIHGYTPEEMRDDEKCAEAAVRALLSKLEMADGKWTLPRSTTVGVARRLRPICVK